MNIKTKFDKNQTIWTIHENKPYAFEVRAIKVLIDYYGQTVQYCAVSNPKVIPNSAIWFDEVNCFASKQALLKSL